MYKIKKNDQNNKKKTLNELMKLLPKEIVRKIRFMTHKPQKRKMLSDIKNYIIINKYLRNMYHMRLIIKEGLLEPEDKYWLINDFYSYLNKNNPLMHGYISEFYKFFKRRKNINTKKQVIRFTDTMDKKDVSTQINVFLAMMNNYERIKFADYCLKLETY